MTPPTTHRGSTSTKGAIQDSPPKKSLFGHELDSKSVSLATLARDVDPAAARLWNIFEQAKQDFFAATEQNSTKKRTTAKFLRDTAENTLQYLQDKSVDHQLLEELETTLSDAKKTVMTFYGGKRRKFDQPESPKPVERTMTARPTQNDQREAELGYRTRDRDSRDFEESTKAEFAGHKRALAYHRSSTPPGSVTHSRRNEARELFPDEQRSKRRRKNPQPQSQPGRGHSDIPFGYSRRVDSYHPSFERE